MRAHLIVPAYASTPYRRHMDCRVCNADTAPYFVRATAEAKASTHQLQADATSFGKPPKRAVRLRVRAKEEAVREEQAVNKEAE